MVLHFPDLSRHWYVHVEKTPLFQNRYQPDTHYIVPVNSTILSWKVKLERHVNKISDFDWLSFAVTSCDKWYRETSTCVWDHVCHLCCSLLTSGENIPVQMEIMSEYIFLYKTAKLPLTTPRVACGLTGRWINTTETAS